MTNAENELRISADRPVLIIDDETIAKAASALYRAFSIDDGRAFIGDDFSNSKKIAIDGGFHMDTLASIILSELTSGQVAVIQHAAEWD